MSDEHAAKYEAHLAKRDEEFRAITGDEGSRE
jgi:hypothetical protein